MRIVLLFDPAVATSDDLAAVAACLLPLRARVRMAEVAVCTPADLHQSDLVVLGCPANRLSPLLRAEIQALRARGSRVVPLPAASDLAAFRDQIAALTQS